jgi:hypothetical protein
MALTRKKYIIVNHHIFYFQFVGITSEAGAPSQSGFDEPDTGFKGNPQEMVIPF